MDPMRSLLFVPADEASWVREAPERYPADGIIYDLEDALAPTADAKREGRAVLEAHRSVLETADPTVAVRVNAPGSGFFDADLEAVVGAGVDAIVLPNLATAEQVRRAHHVLEHLERTRGVTTPIELVAFPETAAGLAHVEALCAASDRVGAVVGSTGADGDTQRAVGYEFSREGDERLHLLSRVVLGAQAAGVDQLFSGVWTDIDDREGLRSEATFTRRLGYTGMVVIHPSHLEPVNEVFTPDPDRVDRARRLVSTYEAAEGAVRFEGAMVDAAHVATARRLIERAEAFDEQS